MKWKLDQQLANSNLAPSPTMSQSNRLLFKNGVVTSTDTPVTSFLESHSGAYTTTRTHNNGSQLLFWKRHMQRLSNSIQILLKSNPQLLFTKTNNQDFEFLELSCKKKMWDTLIEGLVHDSMIKVAPFLSKRNNLGEESAVTVLVSGDLENVDYLKGGFDDGRICEGLDVYMHIGGYVPPVFGVSGNGANLAVVGYGRDCANAKYSDWVRLRKPLEKRRPPSVSELLLSNDGDHILEGCVTNFFVICLKDKDGYYNSDGAECLRYIEVQTAPLCNGVLPGVIRHVIIDVCLKLGIPFREVAPSWSQHDLWTEAFISSSLRVLQHVETIQVPNSWKSVDSKSWEQIIWVKKRFEDAPGMITSILQREILEQAGIETFPVASFEDIQVYSNQTINPTLTAPVV